MPDVRGVHLAAGDGEGDAGDLRAADQGAPTEGECSEVVIWEFIIYWCVSSR